MIHGELRWGLTMDHIDHAARRSVYLAGVPGDPGDWFEFARQEICVELYAADERPSWFYLIDVGRDAIWAEQRNHRRHMGYAERDYMRGWGSGVGFCKYWANPPRRSAEEYATERVALGQIFSVLTRRQRDALWELAVWDDYRLAAQALGITDKGFCVMVSKARKGFLFWWHEGEVPSGLWRRDRRVWDRSVDPTPRSSWFTSDAA